MKHIGLTTKCTHDGLKSIDISGIRQREYSKSYGGTMYGAAGGALESLIIEGISAYKIRSNIGGSIGQVEESISETNMNLKFNKELIERLTEHTKVNKNIEEVVMLSPDSIFENENGIGFRNLDKTQSLDTLVTIDYQYGIGSFEKHQPIPAMYAKITFISIKENKKMLTDTTVAYGCNNKNYSLSDYAENNGALYNECFIDMIDNFSRQLTNVYFF